MNVLKKFNTIVQMDSMMNCSNFSEHFFSFEFDVSEIPGGNFCKRRSASSYLNIKIYKISNQVHKSLIRSNFKNKDNNDMKCRLNKVIKYEQCYAVFI